MPRQPAKEIPRWKRKSQARTGAGVSLSGRHARAFAREYAREAARLTAPPDATAAANDRLARTGAWRFRRHMAPFAWIGCLLAGAVLLRRAPHPLICATAAGLVVPLLAAWATRHLSAYAQRTVMAWGILTSIWLPSLVSLGFPAPLPGLLALNWAVCAALWVRHYRWRPVSEVPEPEAVPDTSDAAVWSLLAAERRWNGILGPAEQLPGGGRRYPVQLDGIKTTIGTVLAASENIAGAWHKPMTEAYAERDPQGITSRGYLTILGGESLMQVRQWAGAGIDPLAGTAVIGRYADGADTRVKFYTPRYGTRHALVSGTTGSGKALALDTLVPTPSGWTTMGDLKAGDRVYDEAGNSCRVTRAWSVLYNRPCYEITFSDGSKITADENHRWLAETRKCRVSQSNARRKQAQSRRPERVLATSKPTVVTTGEMLDSVRAPDGALNFSIRVAAALKGRKRNLPVSSYTLGAWLGDGHSSGGVLTTADPEIIAEVEAESGMMTWAVPSSLQHGQTCPSYRIEGLSSQLRAAGLLGNKHIPVEYLRAPEDQRRALLAGLLDTDGTCSAVGTVAFFNSNERLARDVLHLVSTLGYKATIRSKTAFLNGKDCGTTWTVAFTPGDKVFRLARKLARQVTATRATAGHRYIIDIRPVPSVPVRCITVDSPNSLYLVGEACIPTHNSELLNLLIFISLVTGWFVPVVLDPQEGQSLPFWRDRCLYAAGVDECHRMLRGLHAGMLGRSRYLSGLRWEDDGISMRGMPFFDYELTGLPMPLIMFDEAHMALKGSTKGEREVVSDTVEIGRLGRKTGTGLLLATHIPGLTDLGGEQALRDMLRGGNVVSMRTANRVGGPMLGLEKDPSEIPRFFADGRETYGLGYTAGPDNRPDAPMRSDLVPKAMRRKVPAVPRLDDRFLEAMDAAMGTQGVLLPRAEVPQPEEDDQPAGRRCIDAVWQVLSDSGKPMERGDIIWGVNTLAETWDRKPWVIRSITSALTSLTAGDAGRVITKVRDGVYAATGNGGRN